jgi:hypothetical protein
MRRQPPEPAGENSWTHLLLDDTGTEPDELTDEELAVAGEHSSGSERESGKLKNKQKKLG